MRLGIDVRCLLVALAFLAVRCSGVSDPNTAPLVLTVKGFDVEWTEVVLEGARVCETDTGNCEMTDARGEATLQLPIDQETSYTVEKEGYGSYIAPEVIPAAGKVYWIGVRSDEHLTQQFERVNSPYPMRNTGRILLELSPRFEGATYKLVNATGKPYYYDENGFWSTDLKATTSWGWGGFVEVGPGVFEVILGGDAFGCVPSPVGWPGTEANRVRFPVKEGFTTTVDVACAVPP